MMSWTEMDDEIEYDFVPWWQMLMTYAMPLDYEPEYCDLILLITLNAPRCDLEQLTPLEFVNML